MTSSEIKTNVERMLEDFSADDFIYNLMLAYDTPRSFVTRIKKGDFNLSKKAR